MVISIFLEKRGARPFAESDGEEVGQKSEKRWSLENVSRGTRRKLAAPRSLGCYTACTAHAAGRLQAEREAEGGGLGRQTGEMRRQGGEAVGGLAESDGPGDPEQTGAGDGQSGKHPGEGPEASEKMASRRRDQHQTRPEGTRPGRRILESSALTLLPERSRWGPASVPCNPPFRSPCRCLGPEAPHRSSPPHTLPGPPSSWGPTRVGRGGPCGFTPMGGWLCTHGHARLLLRDRAALPHSYQTRL